MRIVKKITDKTIKAKNQLIFNFFEKKYKNKKVFKQTKINGQNILVFLGDKIGRQIYCLKKFEQADADFLKKIAKPDWVSLDIGANIGYYSLLLASLSPQGRVYAFEPNELNFHILNLNKYLNNLKNLNLNNLALSDKGGLAEFCLAEDSGFSSFKNTNRQQIKEVIKVKAETLDSFASANAISKINFIKLDVEGAEKLVLQGAENVLKTIRPELIMIEVCEENLEIFGESGKSIVSWLGKFGYQPYALADSRLVSFSGNDFGRSPNIYFARAENADLFIYEKSLLA